MKPYELLLLIGNQFGDFMFAGGQFFFVVRKISYDEFLFSRMQFELVHYFLE